MSNNNLGNLNGNNTNVLAALMELGDLTNHMKGCFVRYDELIRIVTAGVAINTLDTNVVKQISAIRQAIDA